MAVKEGKKDSFLICMVSLSMYTAVVNLFYNTLLTNLRLFTKIELSTTWGLFCFDCLNHLCCFKCCRKPC